MTMVRCNDCGKDVKYTIKCLCNEWICSRCTLFDLSHSADYDKHHADILWSYHNHQSAA